MASNAYLAVAWRAAKETHEHEKIQFSRVIYKASKYNNTLLKGF